MSTNDIGALVAERNALRSELAALDQRRNRILHALSEVEAAIGSDREICMDSSGGVYVPLADGSPVLPPAQEIVESHRRRLARLDAITRQLEDV